MTVFCAGLCAAVGALACSPLTTAQPPRPPEFVPPGNQSKCRVTGSQSRPLIVEWPSADRAALEVLAQRGLVAVRYAGCQMEVLPRCKVPGRYEYTATTRKIEQVTIRNEDELYASLPMGAAKLEGKLASQGQIDVTMNVVGQWGADKAIVSRADLEGDCRKATHVIAGLTVGAFELTAGASTDASGGAGALGAGASARSARSRETLSSDGDVKACEKATREDKQPPEGCGGLLRVEVAPIDEGSATAAGKEKTCPAGTTLVQGSCQTTSPVPGSATRLLVQVTCGMDQSYVGTREGLRVWIDGLAAQPAEEPRVFNPMSPGAAGPVQFVAFDVAPGEHSVRVEADGCDARETTVQVKPGEPQPIMGRLQPTSLFARPPAGAWSGGIGVEYSFVNPSTWKLEESYSYTKLPVSPGTLSGAGGFIMGETQHFWFDVGFSYAGGNATYIHPSCDTSLSTCPLAGTEGTAKVRFWQLPILVGGRLPLQYVSATAGTGFRWTIITLKNGGGDFGSNSTMGAHIPAFLAVEGRPICLLGVGARFERNFTLGGDVGNFDVLALTATLHATMGCGSEDFGIQ